MRGGDDAHLDEEAGPQVLPAVAQTHRDLEGAASGIDYGADALDPAVEFLVGQKLRGDEGLLAVADGGEVLAGRKDAGD